MLQGDHGILAFIAEAAGLQNNIYERANIRRAWFRKENDSKKQAKLLRNQVYAAFDMKAPVVPPRRRPGRPRKVLTFVHNRISIPQLYYLMRKW